MWNMLCKITEKYKYYENLNYDSDERKTNRSY